jgi:membrane AbrB-like protein
MVVLEALRLPAALLLGAMLGGIALASADAGVPIGRWPFLAAQAVIGCLMARAITPAILGAMLRDWPLLAFAVLSVIAASGLLGWALARFRVLPGSTAVWGTSPGAASSMILMAEAFGADMRLVAFMQYSRVILVSLVATVVARICAPGGAAAASVVWYGPVHWPALAATLALAATGPVLAPLLRIPAGPLLLPLFLGAALHGAGAMTIELPPWLLAASYALIGWSIGLRFTRAIVMHVLRLLPRVAASMAVLIALCGGVGFVLVATVGVDPLTAYLATSPGGADSIAIIAASSHVDLPFVMALQTARFIVVLLVSPALARLIARRIGAVPDPAWPGAGRAGPAA